MGPALRITYWYLGQSGGIAGSLIVVALGASYIICSNSYIVSHIMLRSLTSFHLDGFNSDLPLGLLKAIIYTDLLNGLVVIHSW